MRISTEDFFNLIQLIQPQHILGKINPVLKNKKCFGELLDETHCYSAQLN